MVLVRGWQRGTPRFPPRTMGVPSAPPSPPFLASHGGAAAASPIARFPHVMLAGLSSATWGVAPDPPTGTAGASPLAASCPGVPGRLLGVSSRRFWGRWRVMTREEEAAAKPGWGVRTREATRSRGRGEGRSVTMAPQIGLARVRFCFQGCDLMHTRPWQRGPRPATSLRRASGRGCLRDTRNPALPPGWGHQAGFSDGSRPAWVPPACVPLGLRSQVWLFAAGSHFCPDVEAAGGKRWHLGGFSCSATGISPGCPHSSDPMPIPIPSVSVECRRAQKHGEKGTSGGPAPA